MGGSSQAGSTKRWPPGPVPGSDQESHKDTRQEWRKIRDHGVAGCQETLQAWCLSLSQGCFLEE